MCIVTCSDKNTHLCIDAFKFKRSSTCALIHSLNMPPLHALCCPALEQLILQKLPLDKVCTQHVQSFLRRVHPTAAMIKQLSFSWNGHSKLVEHIGPYLEVSGATLGTLSWNCFWRRHVVYCRHFSTKPMEFRNSPCRIIEAC